MANRNYNDLDPYLRRLSNDLSWDKDEERETNSRFHNVVEKLLIPSMLEADDDFKKLYQRIHYSGSFFENLRICKPDEFDLNLELRSQSKGKKFLQISDVGRYPGYVQIKRLSSEINSKWVNGNECIITDKINNWLQSVVDKALHKIDNGPWPKIWRKRSGPAVTICIEYSDGSRFSVDLVPVFVFGQTEWLKYPVRQPVTSKNSNTLEWCVVPKPNAYGDYEDNLGTYWRTSYYNQEKDILNNTYHLKFSLKLVKMLRDKEGWHCLKSYYLKTVSLWTAMENPDRPWDDGIGKSFMNALTKLKHHLERSIPFFWDERLNLLSSVNDPEIQKIINRLDNIIKTIDKGIDNKNPEVIMTYFQQRNSSCQNELPAQDPPTDVMCISTRRPNNVTLATNNFTHSVDQTNSTDLVDLGIGVGIGVAIGAFAIGSIFVARALHNSRD